MAAAYLVDDERHREDCTACGNKRWCKDVSVELWQWRMLCDDCMPPGEPYQLQCEWEYPACANCGRESHMALARDGIRIGPLYRAVCGPACAFALMLTDCDLETFRRLAQKDWEIGKKTFASI